MAAFTTTSRFNETTSGKIFMNYDLQKKVVRFQVRHELRTGRDPVAVLAEIQKQYGCYASLTFEALDEIKKNMNKNPFPSANCREGNNGDKENKKPHLSGSPEKNR